MLGLLLLVGGGQGIGPAPGPSVALDGPAHKKVSLVIG